MPWYNGDYPLSYKNQPYYLREKAVEIANEILKESGGEGIAIATGLKGSGNILRSTLKKFRKTKETINMPAAVIKSYSYDPETQIFEVQYHSGKIYHYLHVPESKYRQFKATMVKGIWFNRYIKGKYPFKEVTPGLQQTELIEPPQTE